MLSVVLPVFNAGKTIEKTIESILNNEQERIEIIIVNDGSTDDTKDVLKKYEKDSRFKIIHQKNAGVSTARNRALNSLHKNSQYVAFIDDSDCISKHYIDEHIKILKEYPEINLSIAPIILEKNGKQTPQPLNFRFNISEDIVDIEKYPDFVQYHLGGTVFRTEIFTKDRLRFVENLNFWEDALLINSVILKDKKYGLVKTANYYYDRNNTNSLSHSAWSDEARYTLHIKNSYFPLVKLSERLYGEVKSYIQFLVARHYLQYLLEHNQKSLIKYKSYINKDFEIWSRNLFEYIDIETIDALDCPLNCKIYMYKLKKADINLIEIRKNIKLLIQKIDFKKGEVIFSFSSEASGIDIDSQVFVGTNSKKPARVVENKKKYLLGKETKGDITLNKYSIPLKFRMIFRSAKVQVIDKFSNYEVTSPSLFKRFARKFK